METRTQHGYLVLADISGFTAYLAGVELEHAHEILRELLELIVEQVRPLLTVAQLEGDAVFAYAPEGRVARGETLLELVEAAYGAFKDRLASIRRRTTCTCKACQSVPSLDLKFMTHHGAYTLQKIASADELIGLDVNLVRRRVLKNGVGEATGWTGYAVFTAQSLERLGVHPPEMREWVETVEPLGEIKKYALDLQSRYKELKEARRVFLTPEEAHASVAYDFGAPPPVVWDWLNDPGKRTQWMWGRAWRALTRPGGRTGVGARNHCAHGVGTLIETILDWQPFDSFTVEETLPSGNLPIIVTYQLEPSPAGGGTRLHAHTQLRTSLPDWFIRPLFKLLVALLLKWDFKRMARLMSQAAGRAPAVF
ncbi:MAG TPA: DUF2652 domain-containing protein [Anaerolineales bacterium]|nr:DUF2652 domain-containing protein [Anaerolineales bacterium]